MPQAVVSDSLLYAYDTFQHKNVTEIEKQLLRGFSSLCDWFVDNKISVHFGQDKTKSILFGTKHKIRNAKALNIVYTGTKIKRYEKVKYLECILDQSLSDESIALNVIDKVNSGPKFRHRQNRFLAPPLSGLLCNAMIKPRFDYPCTAWFSNVSKRSKLCLQASQNKCIWLCLQLDNRSKIRVKEFLQLNCLNVHDRYLQFIAPDIFKF